MNVQTIAVSADELSSFATDTVGAFPGQTPGAFVNLNLDAIHITPSVLAVLRNEQITNLYELSELSVARLVRAQGVSFRKVDAIRRQLRSLAERQNSFSQVSININFSVSLKRRLLDVAEVMPARDSALLLRRCGLGGAGDSKPSEDYGISRERVRQIVKRGLSYVENIEVVRATMRHELEAAWVDRKAPLKLQDVEALSPLWEGLGTPREFTVWCLEEYLDAGWHLLADPEDVIARFSQRELLNAINEAKKYAREHAVALQGLAEVRTSSDGVLPEYASELRDWVWAHVEPELHIANDERRGPLVVAYGTDAHAWIVSVLRKAGHPLTADEILGRCLLSGATVETSTIHRAIGLACIAIGDGSYMLRADAMCLARRLEPLAALLSSWLAARNGSFHCSNIAQAHPSIGPAAPFASAAYLCNAALTLYGRSVRGNGHLSWMSF